MAPDKADAQAVATRPFLITFSGIDGAGKTTQIEYLSSCLQKQGLRVLRLSFWDDVAVWSGMRTGVGHRAMDPGRADQMAEHSFSPKNNKHIRKWYLTAARAGFYMLDVARLHRLLASEQVRNSDVVIFDRYIYDQIANIYSQSIAARIYGKLLLKQAPAPDLAFVLDASPAAAFARKPEYPLEFVYRNRQSFLRLRELVPQMIVISDAAAEDVRSEIYFHISQSRLAECASTEEKTDVAVASAVVRPQSSCSVRNEPTASVPAPSKAYVLPQAAEALNDTRSF
jgi:thymidylate kinase